MEKELIKFNEKYFSFIINVFFVLALMVLSLQVVGRGMKLDYNEVYETFSKVLHFIFSIGSLFISYYLFLIEKITWGRIVRLLFLLISVLYFIFTIQLIFSANWFDLPIVKVEIIFSFFISFLSFSYKLTQLAHSKLHASLLFVLSFGLVIFIGSFLLMLPASTTKEISYIDALFTSTSAVTVTGLATLSTQYDYTFFGQIVILILIQIGGLGILTFSNLFSLLFKSDSSYKSRALIGGMINESNSSNIFKTLFKIIFITILVETLGGFLIYFSITDENVTDNTFFFSLFHAVSAFCNAGFSTLHNNLAEKSVEYNYFFQMIVSWLIVTGGLGYNVMINHYFLIKYRVIRMINKFSPYKLKEELYINRVNINTALVLRTTFILLFLGTVFFYGLEYNNTLKNHSGWGKFFAAVFNSVVPRTAGFNNINMGELLLPTVLIITFLMWVGASPGSTGGGIKTTTFAVGMMGLINHIRGKDKINFKWKEIPVPTLNLVNSVILLSIFAIGFGTFFMTIFEPKALLKDLFFEIVSAYSTVGLSLGITPSLSVGSKITLIIVMFLGRVGFITFLIGMYRQFFKEQKQEARIYPKEKIYI